MEVVLTTLVLENLKLCSQAPTVGVQLREGIERSINIRDDGAIRSGSLRLSFHSSKLNARLQRFAGWER
jgi:hypothetical protein